MNNYNNYFNHGKKTTDKTPEELVNNESPKHMNGNHTIPNDTEPTKPEEKEPIIKEVIVSCSLLNIREKPSKDSKIIITVKKGDILTVLDKTNKADKWTNVKTKTGEEGFTMDEFVKEV